jgi:signal transduction histidine kinase
MQLGQPLWRAVIVFRVAALAYAAVLMVASFDTYEHPTGGWIVVGVMALWTIVTGVSYENPRRRTWLLLGADLAVSAACLIASRWIIQPEGVRIGAPTLPMVWVAGPVLAFAVAGGRRLGLFAAIIMGVADAIVRGGLYISMINGTVLMLLAGAIFGYIARLTVEAEERLQAAVELDAATRERERLARGIHDSVLQVLALVQRRGAELGGEAAELGRLAGQQEATLRGLVAGAERATVFGRAGSRVDLRALLDPLASTGVTLAAPATAVWLPGEVASEIAAAVRSALDNVAAHAGADAKTWLLVEDEGDHVTVTVRDNGAGFADGRLTEAQDSGRLGVAQSIRGRIRDLGGTVQIVSIPGQGTEVELHVPR